jgi:hypothetical protein
MKTLYLLRFVGVFVCIRYCIWCQTLFTGSCIWCLTPFTTPFTSVGASSRDLWYNLIVNKRGYS